MLRKSARVRFRGGRRHILSVDKGDDEGDLGIIFVFIGTRSVLKNQDLTKIGVQSVLDQKSNSIGTRGHCRSGSVLVTMTIGKTRATMKGFQT
ncbi:hypothetical protein U1Q18_028672 [Sarracenia purpurea var. burkii]